MDDELHCPYYFPRSLYDLIHFHPEWFDGGPGQPGPIFDELNRAYAGLAIKALANVHGPGIAREIGDTLDSLGTRSAAPVAVNA